MVPEGDINIQEIVLKYLKQFEKSDDKERTIKQIVDDIKKKYPSEEQPLIIKELRKYLIALGHYRSHSFGYGNSPSFGSKRDSDLLVFLRRSFQCNEVRAQSNEEYIKYVELLDELTKE